MARNRSESSHPVYKRRLLKLLFCYIVVGILSLAIILGLRGFMNVWARMNSILERLDDYPQLYDSYQKELRDWDEWWLNEGMVGRAKEAAVIYRYLESPADESEKLKYIAELMGATDARIISGKQQEPVDRSYYINEASDTLTCNASIALDRSISLRFSYDLENSRFLSSEISDSFIRRVESGLPGHILIHHDGMLSVYPKDEEGEIFQRIVEGMLSRGELKPDELRKKAEQDNETSSVSWKFNVSSPSLPESRYILYCAVYSENKDYVIGVVPASEMLRLAGKRSWSLWFLYVSLMLLLGAFLWRMAIHPQDQEPDAVDDSTSSRLILVIAMMLLVFSIAYIQQMSAISQSEQAAADEVAFLKYVLNEEEARREKILEDYDFLYSDRVQNLGLLLSDHPEMKDPYILYQLDEALGGCGLEITGLTGNPTVSDRALIQPSDPGGESESGEASDRHIYQAVLEDQEGHAKNLLRLSMHRDELDELLKETEPREIIEELTLLDTLHVLAVDKDHRDVITASTNPNWVGDDPKEHDVDASPYFDGYEGLINFDGESCYSIVFQHKNSLIAVGSEKVSLIVYLGGVLVLLIPLALLLLVIYRAVEKTVGSRKEQITEADLYVEELIVPKYGRKGLSPLRFVQGYMVAFFLNSVLLYAITNNRSSGLTYNLVRGTWRHGVNAVTVITCITLASMVFTIYLVLEMLLRYLSRYFTQRGKTIANMLINAAGYVCILVVILYTLSMFGINTTTLVGGVGAAALVFTLGANSLISDVLSGMFIIFDGDYVIGDRVEIGGFSGVVRDITIRNTLLERAGTHEVKIIRNSMVKEMVNKSKNAVTSYLDFQIGRGVELEEAKARINSALEGLSQKYPELIGDPYYSGVKSLPEIRPLGIPLEQCTVSVAYKCGANDRTRLAFIIREELVKTANDLLYDS